MNSLTYLREKYILYLKDRSIHTIILAFTIGVALFELSTIILINRFNRIESKAYALCEKKFNSQHYDTAVEYLKGFVKKFPKSERIMDAMYSLAISYRKCEDFSAEAMVWQKIIQYGNNLNEPERVQEAYYNFGVCQEKLGNINLAIKSYEFATNGPSASTTGKALFSLSRLYEKQNLDSNAALIYRLIMTKFPNQEMAQKAADKIEELNLKNLLSECKNYRVKRGDTLSSIAKRFDTTVALIMKVNGLSDTSIRAGMDLKVP